MLAAVLFAIDPVGLGGVVVRSAPSPAREAWLAAVRSRLPPHAPFRRVPLHIEDDRLLGGLDLSASLAAGRPVVGRGVLADCHDGVAVLSMAERIDSSTGARLAAVLDQGEVLIERDGLTMRLAAGIGLIALDEGMEPNERPPDPLLERLAFRFDLNDLDGGARLDGADDLAAVAEARTRLPVVAPAPDAIIEALCAAAEMMGVLGVRPALLALRAARAHAALQGRTTMSTEDAVVATRLVLVPRALTAPAHDEVDEEAGAPDEADEPPENDGRDPQDDRTEGQQDNRMIDADMVIAAIQGALPDGLLDQVKLDPQRMVRSTPRQGSGSATKSRRRGRPVGVRSGALRTGDRLNLPETLRAATPWQKLRSGGSSTALIQVRRDDFRIRRFVQKQEATTIFAVDASGSAAFQRLAEAKGAVELLLAKAYVSRTRVALIAFRNTGAEVLLAPTRSLARAKRALSDLPGGGGTPLAAGLETALMLAGIEKAKDRTALIVLLSDGRANIGRDGAPGRAAAESDALVAARGVRAAGIGAVYIDTSPRAQPDGDRFARAMGAVYAPLPYVEAAAVSALVDRVRSAQG
jgi:magnesium chelatase subunit D